LLCNADLSALVNKRKRTTCQRSMYYQKPPILRAFLDSYVKKKQLPVSTMDTTRYNTERKMTKLRRITKHTVKKNKQTSKEFRAYTLGIIIKILAQSRKLVKSEDFKINIVG
jgi:hypothetical protein